MAPGSLTLMALVPAIVLAVVAGFVLAFMDRRRDARTKPAPPAITESSGGAESDRRAA